MTAQRYDTVLVHEPGIEPWRGIVMTIKPPRPESKPDKRGNVTQLDQWADVRRESDGIEWKVPVSFLEVLEHRAFGIAAPAPIIAGIEDDPDRLLREEDRRAGGDATTTPASEWDAWDEDEGRTGEPPQGPFKPPPFGAADGVWK